MVVRELARRRSNWRATEDLDAWLVRHGVPGIGGVDTRRLTRHIRDTGAMPGAFGALGEAPDGSTVDEAALQAAAVAEPGTDGVDLVAQVTTDAPYTVGRRAPFRVVAYDFGIKTTILRHLVGLATVEVVPASTTADEVLALEPDGVFLSNGPGDPATVPYAVDAIRRAARPGAGVRHLPRPPAARPPRSAAPTIKLPVRPPRRQPPGPPPARRRGRDHQPEPQLRRRRGLARPTPRSPT